MMSESIGKRIAFLRQKNGWTQQSLGDRLAMSRVAISHIEMDLSIPSERTITLMAGVFKLSPTDLVEGTTYPRPKAERLPELTTIYTELESGFLLFQNDINWLNSLKDSAMHSNFVQEVTTKWLLFLEQWENKYSDNHESQIVLNIHRILKELITQEQHYLR
jgi:transcriptional regulator with XRE-family HTH domain